MSVYCDRGGRREQGDMETIHPLRRPLMGEAERKLGSPIRAFTLVRLQIPSLQMSAFIFWMVNFQQRCRRTELTDKFFHIWYFVSASSCFVLHPVHCPWKNSWKSYWKSSKRFKEPFPVETLDR
ncbi:hypothetical protein SK128_008589 [Halocaridina rubra]|uniref:Uncharacterized protein n=1 Tax=Halocaridina rubra TaxID=373956 RepID=A0AAN8XA22_HALRR